MPTEKDDEQIISNLTNHISGLSKAEREQIIRELEEEEDEEAEG